MRSKYLKIVISVTTLFLSSPGLNASEDPSPLAEGIPGAIGTFQIKPGDWIPDTTTWWIDSDGVNPGVAGCHIGTNKAGKPNSRMFGEFCLSDGLLVESNPGAGELHSHNNDVGHPDKFDCNVWCVSKGSAKGACVAAPAPPCEQSAMCKCE